MRLSIVMLTVVCLGSSLLFAQQPVTPPEQLPPLNPKEDPLDWVLVKWEQAMSKVTSLSAEVERKSIDKVFKKEDVYVGTAKYLKTKFANLASLEMHKKGRSDVFEKYVITGTYLYQYLPQLKVIRVHDLPKPKSGKVADDNLLSFMLGMKAAQAKWRYDMKYVPPPKDDKWYYYLDVLPKQPADKVDFTRARVVLFRSNFMVRQLWFEEPNGNEIIWDFKKVDLNANLRVTEFAKPQVPPGWSMQKVSATGEPRVIRNQP